MIPQLQNVHQINQLRQRLQQHMALYGYECVDVPILQRADLFLIKAGDQIANRLFTFDQHGQQWALRPEFTAAAAYYYDRADTATPHVVRWQFSGPVFEDDPDAKDGLHQRYSIGAELIGLSGALADAEVMAMAMRGLDQLGVREVYLTIGHTAFVRGLLRRFDLDARTLRFLLHHLAALRVSSLGQAFVLEQFDRFVAERSYSSHQSDTDALLQIDKGAPAHFADEQGGNSGPRSREEIVQRLLKRRERAAQRPQVIEALRLLESLSALPSAAHDAFSALDSLVINDERPQAILRDWKSSVDYLIAAGIDPDRLIIQADLARNWEYYTGIVFEIQSGDEHLGGGGRYDELTGLVGGMRDVPAVGFAYYVDALLAHLPHADAAERCLTMRMAHEATAKQAIIWAERLRSLGLAVRLERGEAVNDGELMVRDDGALAYGGTIFTMERIDSLIALLRGSNA